MAANKNQKNNIIKEHIDDLQSWYFGSFSFMNLLSATVVVLGVVSAIFCANFYLNKPDNINISIPEITTEDASEFSTYSSQIITEDFEKHEDPSFLHKISPSTTVSTEKSQSSKLLNNEKIIKITEIYDTNMRSNELRDKEAHIRTSELYHDEKDSNLQPNELLNDKGISRTGELYDKNDTNKLCDIGTNQLPSDKIDLNSKSSVKKESSIKSSKLFNDEEAQNTTQSSELLNDEKPITTNKLSHDETSINIQSNQHNDAHIQTSEFLQTESNSHSKTQSSELENNSFYKKDSRTKLYATNRTNQLEDINTNPRVQSKLENATIQQIDPIKTNKSKPVETHQNKISKNLTIVEKIKDEQPNDLLQNKEDANSKIGIENSSNSVINDEINDFDSSIENLVESAEESIEIPDIALSDHDPIIPIESAEFSKNKAENTVLNFHDVKDYQAHEKVIMNTTEMKFSNVFPIDENNIGNTSSQEEYRNEQDFEENEEVTRLTETTQKNEEMHNDYEDQIHELNKVIPPTISTRSKIMSTDYPIEELSQNVISMHHSEKAFKVSDDIELKNWINSNMDPEDMYQWAIEKTDAIPWNDLLETLKIIKDTKKNHMNILLAKACILDRISIINETDSNSRIAQNSFEYLTLNNDSSNEIKAFAHRKLLEKSIQQGEYNTAINHALKLIEMDPDDYDLQVELSTYYMYAGLIDKSQTILENVLLKNPTNGLAQLNLGSLLMHTISQRMNESKICMIADMLCKGVDNSDRNNLELRHYGHLYDAMIRCNKEKEALNYLQQGTDVGILISPFQICSSYIPGFETKQFWGSNEVVYNFSQLSNELNHLAAINRTIQHLPLHSENQFVVQNGNIETLELFLDGERQQSCDINDLLRNICKSAANAIKDCNYCDSYIIKMSSGAAYWKRSGITNLNLRTVWILSSTTLNKELIHVDVGNQTTQFKNEYIIFDNSFVNRIKIESNQESHTYWLLIIDSWHPNLDHDMKKSIRISDTD